MSNMMQVLRRASGQANLSPRNRPTLLGGFSEA